MLDHGDRLTSENGLVNPEHYMGHLCDSKYYNIRRLLISFVNFAQLQNSPEGGGVDLHEPEVSGDTVTDRDLEDVTGDDVNSLDLLHAVLVGPDHLAGLRLVLLEGLNGVLSVPLLHRAH